MTITPTIIQNFIDGLNEYALAPDNPLKSEQRDAFDKLIPALEDGVLDGYYDMATGVGKTVLFNCITKALLSKPSTTGKKTRVLVLVPTKQLVDQTVESFVRFMPEFFPNNPPENVDFANINMKDAKVGAYYSGRLAKDTEREIVVTTYSALVADRKKESERQLFKTDNYELVVLDEAHKALGPETLAVLRQFEGEAVRLGFSATPEYNVAKSVAALLLKNCLHKIDVAEAHDKELLSPFGCYIVKTGLAIDKSDVDVRGKGEAKEFNPSQLAQKLNTKLRNMKAIKLYMNWQDPETGERLFGQTGIVSCVDTTHAKDFAELCNRKINETPTFRKWLAEEARIRGDLAEAGGNHQLAARFRDEGIQVCATIDYNTPLDVRRQLIADHKAGKLLLLAGVRIPAEGFDNRRTGFLFSLADTLSLPKKKQEGGRALRVDPLNPGKYARIFEFVDEEKYLETLGTDRAPILYPETLSSEFQFRSSADVAARHKKGDQTNGQPHEYHEPPPAPMLEDREEDREFDQITVEQPQKVLEIARKRFAARQVELPAGRTDWISSGKIAVSLSFGDDDDARAAVDRILKQMAERQEPITLPNTDSIVTTDRLIDGPYRDVRALSMFIEPRLYAMKVGEISEALSKQVTRKRTSVPLPENRQDWIPVHELPAKAAGFGIEAPPLAAVQRVVRKFDDTPTAQVRYQPAADKPVMVSKVEHLVEGPYFNGTMNTLVVHPDFAYHVLQEATKAHKGEDIPPEAHKRGHTLNAEAIAEKLNVEPTDENIGRIKGILADTAVKVKDQRIVDIGFTAPAYADKPEWMRADEVATDTEKGVYVSERMLPLVARELNVPSPPLGRFAKWNTPADFVKKLGLEDDPEAEGKIRGYLEDRLKAPNAVAFPLGGHLTNKEVIKGPFLELSQSGFKQSLRATDQFLHPLAKALEVQLDRFGFEFKICAEDLYKQLERDPNPDGVAKIEAYLAREKTKDREIEVRPVPQGGTRHFAPYTHFKGMADAIGVAPPLSHSGKTKHISLPQAAERMNVGTTPPEQDKFRRAVEAMKVSKEHGWKIAGPFTRGDYEGLFIRKDALGDLQAALTATADSQDQYIREQQAPLGNVVGWIDPYLMRDEGKRNRVLDFCRYLAQHPQKQLLVSDHFVPDYKYHTMKQVSRTSKTVDAASLIQPGAAETDLPKVHPTLLPYFCMALGHNPAGCRYVPNYVKLFPPITQEHKGWLPLQDDRPNIPDMPVAQYRNIRPLLGKWITEGKQVPVEGQSEPKDVMDMVSIHPEPSFNRLTYYIDPQLIPAIKQELGQGQGSGWAAGVR